MKTFKTGPVLVGVLLSFAICGTSVSSAAHLETDAEQSVRRPSERRLPPRPRGENPLKTLVRRIDIGSPTHYRHMSIFPLLARTWQASSGIRTLDEAFDNGWISVREKDRAEVSELRVRNDSRHYVLLMAGEIIAGGKQNRIVKSDVLLGPRSGYISVPVYCGEKERWTTAERGFRSEKGLADGVLRRKAASAKPQGEIWNEIDTRMRETKVDSRTRDYRQIYRDREVGREVAGCVAHYRRFCGSRTVGAVVMVGGRIVSCDVFSDPSLASALWDKLIRSYSLDLIRGGRYEEERKRRRVPGDRAQIRTFLNGVLRARFTTGHTAGEGRSMRISGSVQGAVLNWRESVVHAALFPAAHRILDRRKGDESEPVPEPYFRDQGPKHEDGKIWR